MNWFTSDLHIGHAAVIKFCARPFQDVQDMNHALCRKWTSSVKPWDTIYVLGDLCFLQPRIGVPIVRELPGKKILIKGNHDKWSTQQYTDAGFALVCDEMVISMDGFRVRLSHYPYAPIEVEPAYEMRYLDRRPKRDPNERLLCGHVHEKWKERERQINVGVDQWGFAPVSQGQLSSLMMRQEKSSASPPDTSDTARSS